MSDPYGSYRPNPTPGWPAGSGVQPTITLDKRPGTVTAAGVITIVLSALALVGGIIFAVLTTADRDGFRNQLLQNSSFRDEYSADDTDTVITVLLVMSIVTIVLAVIAIALAVGVLRRSRVARVLLTVSAAITIVPSAIAIFAVVGLLWLAGAITVIVLLYVGGANPWFSGRSRPPAQPTYPGYPGYPPRY